jgi:hypothetical protein
MRAGNRCLFMAFFTCKMPVNRPECHGRSVISVFSSLPIKFILPEQTDFIKISVKYYDYVFLPSLPGRQIVSVLQQIRSDHLWAGWQCGKGKVHPRTGHEGPEGEQRYSSTLSLISALDGGGWSTPSPSCFIPGKDTVPIA